MCEATAYLLKNGKEEIILEDVDLFEAEEGQIKLVSIFGEEKKVKARIKTLSLVDHKIILEDIR
jgi:predicted RNA-binding protein